MYRLLKCAKDTYITNRIIDNTFRATDANVGRAGTLDLFKLYDESTINGESTPTELSRLFVKFDFNPLRALTGSIVDINDGSFKATLRLKDVVGGQPLPSNFSVNVHVVSKSWDEGVGRDVGRYSDLDSTNWVTASTQTGLELWNTAGADAEGLLGSSDIDIISSGNLNDGLGLRNLYKSQTFPVGDEDLEIDITDLVSGTLVGLLPDEGYRIAFTDTFEQNSGSYFVKRFGTRHTTNPRLSPVIEVKFDDSIRDNHENFVFDTTGSLYLYNSVNGTYKNLVSGSAGTQLTGSSALKLKVISGSISPVTSQSFTASYSVDQFSYGDIFVSGVYRAQFALSSFDDDLKNEVANAGSASFHTVWMSNDETVAFLTSSFVVKLPDRTSRVVDERALNITMPNIRQVYRQRQKPRIRVTAIDVFRNKGLRFSRLPFERKSIIFENMHWRLVDVYSGEVIVPWDTTDNSTRLSTDSEGMYFDFWPADYSIGRVFGFEFLINDNDEELVIDKNLPTFRIEV